MDTFIKDTLKYIKTCLEVEKYKINQIISRTEIAGRPRENGWAIEVKVPSRKEQSELVSKIIKDKLLNDYEGKELNIGFDTRRMNSLSQEEKRKGIEYIKVEMTLPKTVGVRPFYIEIIPENPEKISTYNETEKELEQKPEPSPSKAQSPVQSPVQPTTPKIQKIVQQEKPELKAKNQKRQKQISVHTVSVEGIPNDLLCLVEYLQEERGVPKKSIEKAGENTYIVNMDLTPPLYQSVMSDLILERELPKFLESIGTSSEPEKPESWIARGWKEVPMDDPVIEIDGLKNPLKFQVISKESLNIYKEYGAKRSEHIVGPHAPSSLSYQEFYLKQIESNSGLEVILRISSTHIQKKIGKDPGERRTNETCKENIQKQGEKAKTNEMKEKPDTKKYHEPSPDSTRHLFEKFPRDSDQPIQHLTQQPTLPKPDMFQKPEQEEPVPKKTLRVPAYKPSQQSIEQAQQQNENPPTKENPAPGEQ